MCSISDCVGERGLVMVVSCKYLESFLLIDIFLVSSLVFGINTVCLIRLNQSMVKTNSGAARTAFIRHKYFQEPLQSTPFSSHK